MDPFTFRGRGNTLHGFGLSKRPDGTYLITLAHIGESTANALIECGKRAGGTRDTALAVLTRPKPEAPAEIRGEFAPIETAAA